MSVVVVTALKQGSFDAPPLEHAALPFQTIISIFSRANFVFSLPEPL